MTEYTPIKRSHVSVLDFSENVKGMWSKGMNQDKPTALITCIHCGSQSSLSRFNIGSDGKVSPSHKCPVCHFHAWLILEDWEDA